MCVCVCTRYASCSNSIFENNVIIMNSILYTPTLQPCFMYDCDCMYVHGMTVTFTVIHSMTVHHVMCACFVYYSC